MRALHNAAIALFAVGLAALAPEAHADPGNAPAGASGSIAAPVVARVIRTNLARIRNCYEQQLRSTPSLTGRVDMSFTIAPDGSISSATPTPTTPAMAPVGACIAAVLRTVRFPPPGGSELITVHYPFVFNPG